MTDSSPATSRPLHQLAARLGLYRDYVAASGETREVSESSLGALAAALGYPAATEAEIEQALESLEASRRGLDPVLVVREGRPVVAEWHAAANASGAEARWRAVLEDGSGRNGVAPLTVAKRDGDAARIELPELSNLPLGYHRLEIDCAGARETTRLIVVPQKAYTPTHWSQPAAARDWSITTQLYSLRSSRNWGIGDFTDLAQLGRDAAACGASSIGLNPLHALFPANPRHLSPYSPSSRAFLNPIYIDVEAVPEFSGSDAAQAMLAGTEFQRLLQAARSAEFVDHPTVWRLKLQALRLLHGEFTWQRQQQPDAPRARGFDTFVEAGGTALRNFAVFEALQQQMIEQGHDQSWHAWPEEFRDSESPAVAEFAESQRQAVEFSLFLQFEADRQLGAAAQVMRSAGMATGLYRDVAVGVDPNGAEAWGDHGLLVAGASVGAPPDVYNPRGQDWGLTPFNPVALEQRAFEPFVAAVRANMRHAGAVRIDHVIGMKRLYWVPSGSGAADGGYVAYPYDQLMGIIALESQRERCIVVGEDLGTVPEGFREDAAERAVLSYRVLMFEREDGDGPFLPPSAYPELAAAAVSTHDLPTLAGLWTGRDLEWRRKLGLYPDEQAAAAEVEFRRATRTALLKALVSAGDLPADEARRLEQPDGMAGGESLMALIEAAYRYLARAPSRLLLVQLEDLAAEEEQMNLPGTVDEHPNWRRKLGKETDAVFADPAVQRLARSICEARAAA